LAVTEWVVGALPPPLVQLSAKHRPHFSDGDQEYLTVWWNFGNYLYQKCRVLLWDF